MVRSGLPTAVIRFQAGSAANAGSLSDRMKSGTLRRMNGCVGLSIPLVKPRLA